MNKKDPLWSSIPVLIAAVIAILAFIHGSWRLALLVGVFVIWGLWALVTRGFPAFRAKHTRQKRRRKANSGEAAEPALTSTEACPALTQTLLRHINYRISDKLKAHYPGARWEWMTADPVHLAVYGGIGRIRVHGVLDHAYADVELDPNGRLTCSLVKALEEHNAAQSPPPDEQALEPQVWYELRGRKMLETLIADLDSRGHNCLILKEDGCICVQPVDGGEETVEDILCDFPEKPCWPGLTKVLEQAGLAATVREDCIMVAW